jgi:hypothetical protein
MQEFSNYITHLTAASCEHITTILNALECTGGPLGIIGDLLLGRPKAS